MRIVQRVTAFFLAAVLMTSPFTAMAATSTKISGVSLRIASDIEVGSSGADVSVSTISSKYYVEEVEIKNEPSDEWEDGDKPKIKVTLEAADDYYFASGFSKGDVNLTGNDGTVTSVSRTSSTLVVSITLEALEGESEYDLDVDGLDWDAEDGTPTGMKMRKLKSMRSAFTGEAPPSPPSLPRQRPATTSAAT